MNETMYFRGRFTIFQMWSFNLPEETADLKTQHLSLLCCNLKYGYVPRACSVTEVSLVHLLTRVMIKSPHTINTQLCCLWGLADRFCNSVNSWWWQSTSLSRLDRKLFESRGLLAWLSVPHAVTSPGTAVRECWMNLHFDSTGEVVYFPLSYRMWNKMSGWIEKLTGRCSLILFFMVEVYWFFTLYVI